LNLFISLFLPFFGASHPKFYQDADFHQYFWFFLSNKCSISRWIDFVSSIFVPWEYPSQPLTIFTDSRLSWFKINQSFIKEIFLSIFFDDFRNLLLHSQVSFSNCHILYPTSCIFLIYSNHEKIILTQNDLWINYLTNYRISILIICFLLSVLWEIFIFLINFLETFQFAFILFFIHFI
jgi:hypothetical protein